MMPKNVILISSEPFHCLFKLSINPFSSLESYWARKIKTRNMRKIFKTRNMILALTSYAVTYYKTLRGSLPTEADKTQKWI